MSQIHVILGSDEGSVSEQALSLYNELKPEGADDFSQEVVDGAVGSAEDAYLVCGRVVEALRTLPMFGGGKTVWLKNANFFASDRTSEAERTKEGVEALIDCLQEGLPEDVQLIINCPVMNKGRRLYKFLNGVAEFKVFDKVDTSRDGWQDQVTRLVRGKANELGLQFEAEALSLFVNLAGADTRQIDVELEKIDVYLGERREVTVDDVRLLVPLSHAGVVFEIGSALQRKDAQRAFELVDQQLARKESAIAIMRASIIPTVRNLFMAAVVSQGKSIPSGNYNQYAAALNALPENERSWLPRKKDGGVSVYPMFLASGNVGGFGIDKLRRAMKDCLDADKSLVTTQLDQRVVLHRLIATICAA